MEGGRGIGRDPYAHLNKVVPSLVVALNDPNHPINRPPDAAPPFKASDSPSREQCNHHPINNEVNIPDRFELFLLGEGEKKITEAPDTRTPNSSIFTIAKEDHTLGNLLRAHLLKDPHVLFAGYRVPHPLFASFELRVQTDGEITPKEAVVACCRALVGDLGQLQREFVKEYYLRKQAEQKENAGIEK